MTTKNTLTRSILWISLVLVLLACPVLVSAQENTGLSLRLSRDFGYGGMGNDIQGLFSLHASGPDDLERVLFYIDDQVIGEDRDPPLKLQFNTDEYALGQHNLSAVGYTQSGIELRSNIIVADFVSAEEGWQAGGRIAIPLLALVFGLMLVSYLITFINVRRHGAPEPGEPRQYGYMGGTICPKCQRPFPRNLFGFNMLTRRFEQCPYCGKWSFTQRCSIEQLRQAEQAELENARAHEMKVELSEEEKLRRDLENSRFSNKE